MARYFISILCLFHIALQVHAQKQGDTVRVGNKKMVLTGSNLIANPGFENNFTGWTDGTLAALSSTNFAIVNSGGINNSKYLVGTANAGAASVGSLATAWNIQAGKIYYFSYHVKYQNTSTPASPEIYLKTSLTNSNNLADETVKLIDTSYVNGGGVWTKNEVAFTNTNPSYAYLVARFRWLNNRFGFDDFALYEATELPNNEGLQAVINQANGIYSPTASGAKELQLAINTASNVLNSSSVAEINQAIAALNQAIFAYKVANTTGVAPTVTTNPNFARGATMFLGRSTFNGNPTSFLEHGFCWSTRPEPTIFDNRTTDFYTNNGYIYYIKNLIPSTVYYMRAYVLTHEYAVGYGDIIKVITIPKGTVSYSLSSNVAQEHYSRIENAMASSVNYYNELTSIQGHRLSVNYGSGTPTAEASYGGWMRFGPSASYQQTGTALHEIAHTIGVGTHSLWSGPTSPLRETGSSGAWLGDRTTKLLQFIDNDAASYLRGDATHMWPYGINGAHEDNGTPLLYIQNALIAQALGEDGLPPTGGFATPAYTFNVMDNAKYYIKSEDVQTGLLSSFVVEENGKLVNRVMTANEAIMNDNAAWQIQFNPINSYYTIRNVATGKYFTYTASGNNGISTIQKTTPSSAEQFQLMMGRVNVNLESLTTRGYWIIHPEHKSAPNCLVANIGETTLASGFNIANTSTKQRWLILSSKDLEDFGLVLFLDKNETKTAADSEHHIYVKNSEVHIESYATESDVMIYNSQGEVIAEANNINTAYSQRLPIGLYIVAVSSASGKIVRKVEVW